MRPGVGFVGALGVLTRGAVTGRCPACGRASMFRGYYAMHERCPNCGLLYEVESGAWIGTMAVGYGVGALVVLLLTFVELAYQPLDRLGLDPFWTIPVVAALVTLVAYRPAKGLWFALLWLYGFTEDGPGNAREGAPSRG